MIDDNLTSESQSNPGIKMIDPEPCKEIPMAAAGIVPN